MNDSFKKFKKRFLTEAIIKTSVCALSAGLFTAGVILLALKLSKISINAGYYVLIGVCVAAAVWGLVFCLFRRSEKAVAKRIDNENALGEKIQTMVEFADRDGDIYELQRSDAAQKLDSLPKRKPNIKHFWQYILIGVIAVAVFVTAVALPYQRKDNGGKPDLPFNYSERQEEALNQLVTEVNGSSLAAGDKQAVVTLLGSLSDSLKKAATQSTMKIAVLSTVSLTDTVLYTSNSFDNLAYVLNKTDDLKTLASAIEDGAGFYKLSGIKFRTYDLVKQIEKNIDTLIRARTDENVNAFKGIYNVTKADGLADKIMLMNTAIKDAAATVSGEDALKSVLSGFADGMTEVVEGAAGSWSDTYLQETISSRLNSLSVQLTDALVPQSYKCVMDDYIRYRLIEIFSISEDELPRLLSGIVEVDSSSDPSQDPDDNKTQEGGYGKGDKIYGSNSYIYYPDTDEYVLYGEYLNVFRARMMEQLESGNLPEDLQESIKEYFRILSSGLQTN